MKRIATFLIFSLFVGAYSYGQKKSGTVFSEHEAIEKTIELWKAVADGDEAKYRSYFADSAYVMRNGEQRPKMAKADIGKGIGNLSKNYKNFKVGAQKPAYPDAIEYKDGGTWVQDWLLMEGIHKKTGVVLELPIHNVYRFNDKGQIDLVINYFDDDVFEEISNSQKTLENGKVYINHPHIVSVRKLLNAFAAGDMEEWASYYTPDARFTSASMKFGESRSLEEHKEAITKMWHSGNLKFKIEQIGYPDCIYYEKSSQYVVYSWWNMIVRKDGKTFEIPYMLTHNFNDEGKITFAHVYVSSNHFDQLGD